MRTPAALVCLVSAALALAAAEQGAPPLVLIQAASAPASPEALIAAAARADVVFVGETYGDRATHRVERWLVDTVSKVRGDVILALEMFERDVQDPLDHFQMGHLDEAEWLAAARPWPDYAAAYKPIVDVALTAKWPIVATNLPRAIADRVAASGLDARGRRDASTAQLIARDVECPADGPHFTRFKALTATTASLAVTPAPDARSVDRFYLADCLKDETMAESIATAHTAGSAGGKSPLVISLNDRFRTDYREGVVERTERRLPGKTIVTIAIVPVASLEPSAFGPADRARADYVVLVAKVLD